MTQRKRATHYALMDAAFAADRKFIRLARNSPKPTDYAAAVGVFWLLLADCRRAKSPDIDWSEYEEYTVQVQLLKDVGLLCDTGFPPGPFEKWAPVYKSPWDAGRKGTQRYAKERDISSVQFSSTEGGPGETEQGVWNGAGSHNGQHGPDCAVCAPLIPSKKLRAVK